VKFIGVSWTKLRDVQAITEYMDMGDLRTLLDQDHSLTWTSPKLLYAKDIIEALVYLHSLTPKLLHRDLKTKNVLIDTRKGAKLADFGVAIHCHSDLTKHVELSHGVGTNRWIAPEVLCGHNRYTEAVDIYSFGVILSELDSHSIPFHSARTPLGEDLTDMAILQYVASGKLKPEFSDSCPKKILELAHKCLCVDPRLRPSAQEVASILNDHNILDQVAERTSC